MENETKELIKDIVNNTKDGIQIIQELVKRPETEYILKITDDIKDGLNKGIYFLAEKSDGDGFTTMVREIDGESSFLKTNLSVVTQLKDTTNYEAILTKAFQMEMRAELRSIEQKLDTIDKNINSLLDDNRNSFEAKINLAIKSLKKARNTRDELDRKNELRDASTRLDEVIELVQKKIETKLAYFKPVPERDFRIGFNIVVDSNYKTKKDNEFNEIYDLFELYHTLVNHSFLVYKERKEFDLYKNKIDDVWEWQNKLYMENLKTIVNLYPEDDLSEEWFYDFKGYNDELKKEYLDRAKADSTDRMKDLLIRKMLLEEVLGEYYDQNKENKTETEQCLRQI